MRMERIRKGDLVIDLHSREIRQRHHARKGVVSEAKMDRINDRIHTLMYWSARIGDDEWPIPEPPALPEHPADG